MIRTGMKRLLQSAMALALFATSANALTTGTFSHGAPAFVSQGPGDLSHNFGTVAGDTTYFGSIARLSEPSGAQSFTDTMTFTYNSLFPSSATFSLLSGGTGFTALSWSWMGPDSNTVQTGPINVLSNINTAFNVLFAGTGVYTLQIIGTTFANGGGYNFDMTTGPGGGNEVPLPAAVWLFGTVLAGGIGMMRARRRIAA